MGTNILKSLWRALKKVINKYEFSVLTFEGHDVMLPTYMRSLNLYGVGLQKVKLPKFIFGTCISLFIIFGECYAVYLTWGTIDVFYSLSSSLFGSRNLFVAINYVYKYESLQEMFAIYAKEIWVGKEKDLYLFGHRIVAYIYIPVTMFYTLEPLYKTFILQDGSRNFALGVQYPFDVRNVTWRYVFLVIISFIALLFRCLFVSIFHMILNYMLVHTSYRLEEQTNILLSTNEKLDDYAYNKKMKGVVEVHQTLVSFVNRVQSIFTLGIFLQFGLDSIIICSISLYFLLADLIIFEYSKILGFSAILFLQQYANCMSGERLITTGLQLGDAAYNSDWTTRHLKKNPSVQLLILRAQSPLKITGFNFFELSMTMFATVCKRSLSYFMLIKTFFE